MSKTLPATVAPQLWVVTAASSPGRCWRSSPGRSARWTGPQGHLPPSATLPWMDTSANTRYRGFLCAPSPGNGRAGVSGQLWHLLGPRAPLVSLWWCQHHHHHAAVCPQNPRDADPMTRVQAELDETKIILVRLQGPGAPVGQGRVPPGHPPSTLGWELPLLFPFLPSPLFLFGLFPCSSCPSHLLSVPSPLGLQGRGGGL